MIQEEESRIKPYPEVNKANINNTPDPRIFHVDQEHFYLSPTYTQAMLTHINGTGKRPGLFSDIPLKQLSEKDYSMYKIVIDGKPKSLKKFLKKARKKFLDRAERIELV